MYDIAVIGAGPAGMTAALYAVRAGKRVLLLEGEMYGGQIVQSRLVENYPGAPEIGGAELAMKMMEPLSALGVDPTYGKVTALCKAEDRFEIVTDSERYEARAVIIATGVGHRKLEVPGEDRLIGGGVSFCATCDGMFFRGREVAVVGGGNTAVQDALVLAELCSRVYLIHRRDSFRAEARLVERMKATENIECITDTVVTEMQGSPKLESLILRNVKTEETRTLPVSGVFLAVGNVAKNEAFRDLIELDDAGFILTDADCKTSQEGIFAAGDCRQKKVRQLTTATADGTIAALSAVEYLDA
ncbi:MAG: thioredoxin-disulfide reductase [Clostridia bacterium]|nr:thioredoxin-disulfide reductase [Clostridia bacterium]